MNASVLKGRVARVITGTAIFGVLAFGATAFAQTATAPQPQQGHQGGWMGGGQGQGKAPGVFGTVSVISGTTLTVSSKGFGKNAAAATYTVNAGSATVTKAGAASSVSAIAVGDTVMVQGTVSGTSVAATSIRDGMEERMGMMPGVFGTVASVSGTTLTVTSKAGPNGTPAAATYTVDASSATVTKNNAASSVSAIAVGDTVIVQGAVSGTSVTAKTIRDGVMQGPGMKPQAPIIKGNGEPVVGGAVASISGTTLTVTNKSNVTYSVDASSATIEKGNATSSISNVAVGDNVVVQGTVNGNSVVASSVMDQGAASASGNSGGAGAMMHGPMGGVLGVIGGFFQHLFGFF
jgi:hypothetical protein